MDKGIDTEEERAYEADSGALQSDTGAFYVDSGASQPDTGAYQASSGAFQSSTGAEGMALSAGKSGFPEPPRKKTGIGGFLGKLPALPRFEDKAQRRAGGNIIKFLAILLALTLIARGTSGATLARVDVSSPSRSEIIEAVTGKATVSVKDSLDIDVPEGLTIEDMLAGVGQTVEYGDAVALFYMEEIDEKLIRETAALDKLPLDLEKADRTERTDSTSLDNAMRSLRRVQDDYKATEAQGETDINTAKEALDEAWDKLLEDPDATALESAMRSLNRVKEDYNSTMALGIANIATAQASLNDALDADTGSVDSSSLDNARRSRNRARDDYNTVLSQTNADVKAANDKLDKAIEDEEEKKLLWENGEIDDEEYEQAQADTVKAQTALDTANKKASDDLLSAARKLEDAESSFSQALNNYSKSYDQLSDTRQAAIDKARDALESEQKKADDNLLNAARKVEDAEVSFTNARRDYDKNTEKASDAKQTSIDNAQSALESAQKKAEDNLLNAARKVEDAETSLANAQRDYSRNEQQTADTALSNSLSATTLRLDIEDKKEAVDALNTLSKNKGVLYSDISGVVLSAKAKGSVTGKDALIAFMDGAKGFEAYLQLDKSEADNLSIDDECQISTGGGSMYYSPTVNGAISAITPPDDKDSVQITIRLPDGDWTEGQRVDVRSVQSRSTYDQCVPLSAVRSDNAGYYVLVVEQGSTVLGIENIAIRTPVTILASDDDNAAIQGPVGRNGQVITGSNKTVEAGDRVRING